MAAEANNMLGQHLSLITNSGIRYEGVECKSNVLIVAGILCQLDAEQSTITLQQGFS